MVPFKLRSKSFLALRSHTVYSFMGFIGTTNSSIFIFIALFYIGCLFIYSNLLSATRLLTFYDEGWQGQMRDKFHVIS